MLKDSTCRFGLAIVPSYRRTTDSHCSVVQWHDGQSKAANLVGERWPIFLAGNVKKAASSSNFCCTSSFVE